MKVGETFHLTYCSSIHPGETWREVSDALAVSLPRIRTLLSFSGPLGVGLRLSAQAASTLDDPDALATFRRFLRDGNYYVLTINGFPYGDFHAGRVKEDVYLPDWRTDQRLEYTNRLAGLLASLLADGPNIEGSVSTVPGAFAAHVRSDADVNAIASRLLRHAVFLARLRETTGVTIVLAIEPEPACYMETIDDAVRFFSEHLFDAQKIAAAARHAGSPLSLDDVRRHVGLCFDACHMAVEFEEPASAMRRIQDAGIRIGKIQVTSALHLASCDGSAMRNALGPYAEDRYLHQVVVRHPDGFDRYTDLPEALVAAVREKRVEPCEWRVHFHVPIFMRATKDLETTQPYLASVLDLLKANPVCPYLEVETYTWDVLPAEYRTVDVCTAIARELAWVRTQLES